jgi:hypothetical protein
MQSTGADFRRAFFLTISPHLSKTGIARKCSGPRVAGVDFLF